MRTGRISISILARVGMQSLGIAVVLFVLSAVGSAQPQKRSAAKQSAPKSAPAAKAPQKEVSSPATVSARERTPEPRIVPENQTEITATGSSSFDNTARVAVFIRDVVVADPKFTIYCDRLTVFLKGKDEVPTKGTPAKENESVTEGGIDHGLAEANPGKQVILIQDRMEPDGKITRSVGRGDKAAFDSKTGNLVLTGNPSLQRGSTFTVPAEGGTVITLNRNGDLLIKGATRTLLQDLEEVQAKR